MSFNANLYQCLTATVSSDYPTLYCYNAGADSFATVAAASYFDDLLYRVVTGDKLMVKTSTAGLSFSGTFRNDGSNVYVDWDNTLWLQGQITDVSTESSSFICVPAGLIAQVGGALDTAITVASAVITFEIATVAVTGATLTFTDAMTAGTRVVATATAANVLTSAGTVEIVSDGGSTTASRGNFFVKMICPAQI